MLTCIPLTTTLIHVISIMLIPTALTWTVAETERGNLGAKQKKAFQFDKKSKTIFFRMMNCSLDDQQQAALAAAAAAEDEDHSPDTPKSHFLTPGRLNLRQRMRQRFSSPSPAALNRNGAAEDSAGGESNQQPHRARKASSAIRAKVAR